MQSDTQELFRLLDIVIIVRARALRLGQTTLAALLATSIVGIKLTIAELDEGYARTLPQVEALKQLIGTT